jgi:hypothetical protein
MGTERYQNHRGIPLKELPTTRPGEPIDWDELAVLARQLAPPKDHWKDSGDDEEASETPIQAKSGSVSDPAPHPLGEGATGRSDAGGGDAQV